LKEFVELDDSETGYLTYSFKSFQFDTVDLEFENMNYDDKIEEAQFAASLLLLVVGIRNCQSEL